MGAVTTETQGYPAVETRGSRPAFLWRRIWTETQSYLSSVLMLRHELRASSALMLRRRLDWASRFDVERWLWLASRLDLNAGLNQPCIWSMSSAFDDLSPVIFRQFIEPPLKFSKLRSWLERVWEHFGLFSWQWALKTGMAIFWDTLSLILSESQSSWVHC